MKIQCHTEQQPRAIRVYRHSTKESLPPSAGNVAKACPNSPSWDTQERDILGTNIDMENSKQQTYHNNRAQLRPTISTAKHTLSSNVHGAADAGPTIGVTAHQRETG